MAHTPAKQGDWYADAPRYYDMIFDAGTAQETVFVQQCLARHATAPRGPLLEPACGTGRLMRALAQKGFAVDGYDDSEPMLAMARERLAPFGRRAQVRRGRMEHFVPRKRYRGAYNLVSTFKYLLSEDDAAAHLAHTASALHPGGIYILGLHLSDYEDTRRSRERWHAQSGQTHVSCTIQSWPADKKTRIEQVRSRLTVRRGARSQICQTQWPFFTYNARQLRALLRREPRLAHVATYDFCHDIERARRLNDEQLDTVLVLRRH